MSDEIEITQAGVGTTDGCWIWYSGALHQIDPNEGSQGEIHSLRLECNKGNWSLIPKTKRDEVLWNILALRLLREIQVWQVVV